jgi:hypothetical protein
MRGVRSYGLGLGPVPWVLFGELFPSKCQSFSNCNSETSKKYSIL